MTPMPRCVALSRRSFIVASGGSSIGVALLGGAGVPCGAAARPAPYRPNAWVTIDGEGIVTLMSPSAEMGQGAMTGVPQCLADELDVAWSAVRVEHAPAIPAVFGNPLAHMAMSTHSDFSIQGYFEKVRLIGAQTRRLLMMEAAGQWQVPLADLDTRPGEVVHAASGRRLGYGALARTARVPDVLPEITPAELRPRAQWRLIGQSAPRVDLPAKVSGQAVFGLDVQPAGLVYAMMLYPPVRHEKPLQVDDAAARAVPGVLQVVVLDRGVGVIATRVEAARTAKAALQVRWSTGGPAQGHDSQQAAGMYRRIAADLTQSGVAMQQAGDAPARLASAARVITREFHNEHVAHATIEPPNATAQVEPGRATLWVATQSPSHVIATVSRALGIEPANVTVHATFVGGAFGRLGDDSDPALDAVLLARALPGRPVKLVRSREDEFLNDVFRPQAAQRIDVGLDAQGRVLAWRHRIVSPSHFARAAPHVLKALEGKDIVTGLAEHPYGGSDQLVQFVAVDKGWDIGPMRGVAGGYTIFAIESVIDELAALQRVDPVAYRLRLLKDNPRGQAVLRRVAEMAQWQRPRPKGRALGVALATMSNTTAAQVVEVSLGPRREVRVHRVWTAADAGVVVNPDAVKAQFEGGTVMGLGPALYESIALQAGAPRALNFHAYTPPRMSQAPESIDVELIASEHPPGGVGEIGVTMVAPAIAAALARLTGQRLRSLPLVLNSRQS